MRMVHVVDCRLMQEMYVLHRGSCGVIVGKEKVVVLFAHVRRR